jgi:hypothetical protein
LMGKQLGRRLTERVNDGGTTTGIRARKRGAPRAGRTNGDEVFRGVLRVRTEERKGCGVVRSLFERGRVRQGAVGVGRRGRCVEDAGHEQWGGVPADR